MAAAWLLTLLALTGIVAGSVLGQSRMLSAHLAAAGGGLLFGICLFWLMPEIAEASGWALVLGVALASCVALLGLDRYLMHTGRSHRHGVIGPLLIATALHSFLDGWSVRAVAVQPLASVAVPIGLALHKVPEGLALGWITGKSMSSTQRAILASGAVELLTVVGAWVEPRAERSGVAAFGPSWTAVVLAVVAGSFLFLGFHTVVPERRKAGVVPVFLGAFGLMGIAAWVKSGGCCL
jgi:zinc and cadmium transporter